jgi:hypothetical protein
VRTQFLPSPYTFQLPCDQRRRKGEEKEKEEEKRKKRKEKREKGKKKFKAENQHIPVTLRITFWSP